MAKKKKRARRRRVVRATRRARPRWRVLGFKSSKQYGDALVAWFEQQAEQRALRKSRRAPRKG